VACAAGDETCNGDDSQLDDKHLREMARTFVRRLRAPAPIWEVKRDTAGQITKIRHRKNWPYVKHYSFPRSRLEVM
jgi:hypothetical protein